MITKSKSRHDNEDECRSQMTTSDLKKYPAMIIFWLPVLIKFLRPGTSLMYTHRELVHIV